MRVKSLSVLPYVLYPALTCGLGITSCAAQAPTSLAHSVPNEKSLAAVNTIPTFLAFWNAAASVDESTRVQMFRKMVIRAHPELFTNDVVDIGQSKGTAEEDHQIAIYLGEVRPLVPAIRTLNERLQADLKTYVQGFQEVFPDYRPATPIYFTVSLGHFDGGTREVNGHPALLFGVDLIAGEYGANAKLSVLFDHEIFHQYHESLGLTGGVSGGKLWGSLWEEGLATYVSWRMNPTADENDVLLSKTLATLARPMLPLLASDMLRDLQSEDSKVYANYFLSGPDNKAIPARSGYFLGFLIASRIGQSTTPMSLAHLAGPQLEAQIEQALKELPSQSVTVRSAGIQLLEHQSP